ncbi:TetR/AcrR family transcriptional regulator [Streptomyces sp. NPDC093516]|uniref:TetR/AcrR family transcriptional regulator n=1 Tax=Streptomyces sp. NPDC093516 TaxID=3155304 RepID=UPI0034436EB4
MADIAAAAGVGKGTLFRGFGDRTGLIRALHESRLEPLRQAVAGGPRPLGPATPSISTSNAGTGPWFSGPAAAASSSA